MRQYNATLISFACYVRSGNRVRIQREKSGGTSPHGARERRAAKRAKVVHRFARTDAPRYFYIIIIIIIIIIITIINIIALALSSFFFSFSPFIIHSSF